jgi:hypothetical protein
VMANGDGEYRRPMLRMASIEVSAETGQHKIVGNMSVRESERSEECRIHPKSFIRSCRASRSPPSGEFRRAHGRMRTVGTAIGFTRASLRLLPQLPIVLKAEDMSERGHRRLRSSPSLDLPRADQSKYDNVLGSGLGPVRSSTGR